MAEYINRDSVLLGIEKHMETVFTYVEQSALYNIECMVEKIPAADVVEVVRCNCCKYYDKSTHNCGLDGVKHWNGFFCADGERREDDG